LAARVDADGITVVPSTDCPPAAPGSDVIAVAGAAGDRPSWSRACGFVLLELPASAYTEFLHGGT
jgi:hypothetical protein